MTNSEQFDAKDINQRMLIGHEIRNDGKDNLQIHVRLRSYLLYQTRIYANLLYMIISCP